MEPVRHVGKLAAILFVATTAAEAADKSRYSILTPTPDSQLRDMATDRPDKTESPYTVDAGRIQVETDLVAYTRDERDGITTRALEIAPLNLKIGLTADTDLQLIYGAWSDTRTSSNRSVETDRGFGDVTVRIKHNIWGNEEGITALAVMPFLKLPANDLASLNDHVEGGIIVPLAIDLGHGAGFGLMTEIDILRRESGTGYEPTFINSATVSFELTRRLGMYVEAYVERSAERGAETIVTLDGGMTFAVTDNLQLDAGVNIGVTDAADDLNLFAGMSQRF